MNRRNFFSTVFGGLVAAVLPKRKRKANPFSGSPPFLVEDGMYWIDEPPAISHAEQMTGEALGSRVSATEGFPYYGDPHRRIELFDHVPPGVMGEDWDREQAAWIQHCDNIHLRSKPPTMKES